MLPGMPARTINLIVLHCSATPNGKRLGTATRNAADVIDGWHKQRGFSRTPSWRLNWNGRLASIGYHFVIDTDGMVFTGRHRDEVGAHAMGRNYDSLGICCAGYDQLTPIQWRSLRELVQQLHGEYPQAHICGHRDLSLDLNGDGKITPNEYSKICPGYNVADWLAGGMQPLNGHLFLGDAEPA